MPSAHNTDSLLPERGGMTSASVRDGSGKVVVAVQGAMADGG